MKADDIINNIINNRRDQRTISPAWIATEAMIVIGEITINSAPESYQLAHLQCRQIARRQLRDKFRPKDKGIGETDDLFPTLQWRYPTAKTANDEEEPEYILRDDMDDPDVSYNVDRLRKEADAKNKHADALEAWHRNRRRVA